MPLFKAVGVGQDNVVCNNGRQLWFFKSHFLFLFFLSFLKESEWLIPEMKVCAGRKK